MQAQAKQRSGSQLHPQLHPTALRGPWPVSAIAADPLQSEILPLLPARVQNLIFLWMAGNPAQARTLCEIRLRRGQPVALVYSGGETLLDSGASTEGEPGDGPPTVGPDEIEKTLALVSNCSYYAMESEFANGYVTIPGGHRVGLAGQVSVWADGAIRVREVSSMNFRIAREVRGAGEAVAPRLAGDNGRLLSTLVISPPGCGKTTLLRDLCRISSEGYRPAGLSPSQVSIVDERSEIAACYKGVPQHDLGPRVDVLDRCPKAKGITMLLRSMGPGVIATDEIGSDEDARAVASALFSGASVLATCHGEDVESVRRRPYSSWLVSSGYFERVVVLSGRRGPGTVEYAGAFQ